MVILQTFLVKPARPDIHHGVRQFDGYQIIAIITSDTTDKRGCLLKIDTLSLKDTGQTDTTELDFKIGRKITISVNNNKDLAVESYKRGFGRNDCTTSLEIRTCSKSDNVIAAWSKKTVHSCISGCILSTTVIFRRTHCSLIKSSSVTN